MKLSRTLRYWILGGVFFALLGIQIIESTHHHESAALEEACQVCQVAAHLPLDLAPPAAALISAVLLLLFALPRRQQAIHLGRTYHAAYHSRAPPLFSA